MNVRIAQLLSFNAGAWYDGGLEMNEYTAKLWMITQSPDPEEQNIAFRRMKHFVYTQLDSTIFVDSNDAEKCAELANAGLNITTMPAPGADQLIGIMLFHKLNAVMEGRIAIVEVEISAGDTVVYLHGENETSESLIIPDWWTSADLTHNNLELAGSEKVLSIPQNNAWRDLTLAWPDQSTENETGNIVVFADFKQPNDTK
jgi:hypothetical protein